MSAITEDELREIVEVVWMTALDLAIDSGEATELVLSECQTAEIEISGAWAGVVSIRASEQFLSLAASLMFSCPLGSVHKADCFDTLTELTNMLGGSCKCLLPESCDLSLPSVVSSDVIDVDVKEVGKHEWIHFSCGSRPLAVAVTQAVGGTQQAA